MFADKAKALKPGDRIRFWSDRDSLSRSPGTLLTIKTVEFYEDNGPRLSVEATDHSSFDCSIQRVEFVEAAPPVDQYGGYSNAETYAVHRFAESSEHHGERYIDETKYWWDYHTEAGLEGAERINACVDNVAAEIGADFGYESTQFDGEPNLAEPWLGLLKLAIERVDFREIAQTYVANRAEAESN